MKSARMRLSTKWKGEIRRARRSFCRVLSGNDVESIYAAMAVNLGIARVIQH